MNEFDMEGYIEKRMLEIKDLQQRLLYKEIVGDILNKVYRYQEQAHRQLEERILNETSTKQSDYAIYVTLTDRAHYDATDSFMYPMKPEDTKEHTVTIHDVKLAVQDHKPLKLYTIFLQTNASEIYRLLKDERRFYGVLKTRTKAYDAVFCVKRNERYLDLIKELYDVFMVNDQSWMTVCEAYLMKLLDVYLWETEPLLDREELEEIRIDFEEYDKAVRSNMIPLWNLDTISEKTSAYPDAAIDKINYEHQIFSHRLKAECEYLVRNTDVEITNIRRVHGDLMITCPVGRPKEWEFYQVHKVYHGKNYLYPMLSNQYKESFAGNLTEMFRKSIKTKAEMARLIESFPYQEFLRFRDFEIISEMPKDCEAANYNMDGFILDEIRVGNFRQTLLLKFVPAEPEHYLNEDIMSFLVTQVQKIFPEYQCVGRLI